MENLIELKKITPPDAEFLTNLLNNKTTLKILNEKKSKLKDWQTAIDNWSKDNDEENYIIYCDNIPVGWIGVNSLLPEYRFHGIGQYVVKLIKDELKNRGYLSLKLVTDKENKHAIHCYKKCGFTVTETFTKKMPNGKTVERYKMMCELTSFTDLFITDLKRAEFQQAFKTYFNELDVQIEKWDKLFSNMNNDKHGENYSYVRIDDNSETVGFIQFTAITMNSWFFSTDMGFIREFWVNEKYRKQGHGKELLTLAENYFKEKDIGYAILTTDTAEQFYLKNGYEKNPHIAAVNKMDVYVKRL